MQAHFNGIAELPHGPAIERIEDPDDMLNAPMPNPRAS
jgi:hypothetical protein